MLNLVVGGFFYASSQVKSRFGGNDVGLCKLSWGCHVVINISTSQHLIISTSQHDNFLILRRPDAPRHRISVSEEAEKPIVA